VIEPREVHTKRTIIIALAAFMLGLAGQAGLAGDRNRDTWLERL
jgi:hypothetical protein